ncbi:MAG: HD-GYP domain-containing protein [Candidatus Omnitrophota bacterium]
MTPSKGQTPDYQEVLHQLTRILLRLHEPRRLLKLITRFIDREFHLSHTSFLVFDEKHHCYAFVDSRGARRFPIRLLKFEMSHPFVTWFTTPLRKEKGRHGHLSAGELRRLIPRKPEAGDPRPELLRAMERFKVELLLPAFDKKHLMGILMLGPKKQGASFKETEIRFFRSLAQTCSVATHVAKYHEDLGQKNIALQRHLVEIELLRKKEKDIYRQILRALMREMDAKDPYARDHIGSVERFGMLTAEAMGILHDEQERDIMQAALILHDVGKMGVPDAIISKTGKLNDEEWTQMKSHVTKGVRILEPLETFRRVAEIIRYHHEHFDGRGYPQGVGGKDIPIEARIIAVVDAFDAMIAKRSYNAPRTVEEALDELQRCSGTQFDPKVVEVFTRICRAQMLCRKSSFETIS